MAIDNVFAGAWNEFSKNFVAIILFVLVFLIAPLLVLGSIFFISMIQLGFSDFLTNYATMNFSNYPLNSIASLLIIFLIVLTLSIIVTIFAYSAFYGMPVKNKKYSWRDLASVARKSFLRFLGRSILLGFLLALLYLLLIIPGIIFSIYWIFAIFIWFNEPNKSFSYSLQKSKKMVKGRWWETLGYLLIIVLLSMAVNFVLGFIPVLGDIISLLTGIFALYLLRHLYIDYSFNKR